MIVTIKNRNRKCINSCARTEPTIPSFVASTFVICPVCRGKGETETRDYIEGCSHCHGAGSFRLNALRWRCRRCRRSDCVTCRVAREVAAKWVPESCTGDAL